MASRGAIYYAAAMQKIALFLSLFFSLFALSGFNRQQQTITIAADNWCPINCTRPEPRLGVGIDLAKAIFEPLGYQINYVIMPWSEALAKVRTGEVDAVIGASRYDDARLIFPASPVYNITDDFYVLKGNSWRFQGVHTLKAKKLGVIKDYGYGTVVQEYVRSNQNNYSLIQASQGEDALKENIRKLLNREIDVVVESRPVMEYNINKMRLNDRIDLAGSSPQAQVYLAFSPASSRSKGLATQYDAGISRLTGEGKLDGFYGAYGLSSAGR